MRLLLFLAAAILALAMVAPAPGALAIQTNASVTAAPLKPALPQHEGPLALAMPARGTLTDGYGPRWGRMHQGIDIGILKRLRLEAAADGVVKKTGYVRGYSGYGKVVVLDLGRGFKLLYAHLSRIDVRPGERVELGEPIGRAGCTGSCTGTHLHFEVLKRGRALNPMPFLRRYTRSNQGG